MRCLLILLLSYLLSSNAIGQEFDNGSFEGEPLDATVPAGWFPCAQGTTPDILPGPWGVNLEPSEGKTYVGLITREDGSYESITQKTPIPLASKGCYQFDLDLAKSINYAGSNASISINIYISDSKCENQQKIFTINKVSHLYWKNYKVRFTAEQEASYMIFEAYFPDINNKVSGNILIDDISKIVNCDRT